MTCESRSGSGPAQCIRPSAAKRAGALIVGVSARAVDGKATEAALASVANARSVSAAAVRSRWSPGRRVAPRSSRWQAVIRRCSSGFWPAPTGNGSTGAERSGDGPRLRQTGAAPEAASAVSAARPCTAKLRGQGGGLVQALLIKHRHCSVAAQADLREPGELGRELPRRAQRLTGRYDAIGQTDRRRLQGVDGAPGEDHVHRPAGSDEPGQAYGATVDQWDAPASAEDAEDGRGLIRDP